MLQDPLLRLAALEAAGQERVPFTTGILIGACVGGGWGGGRSCVFRATKGQLSPLPALSLDTCPICAAAHPPACMHAAGIGEGRLDRLEALLHIRRLHRRYGHVQEVIIQNFVPKQGTAMAAWAAPPLSELLWTVAMARLLLGPQVRDRGFGCGGME